MKRIFLMALSLVSFFGIAKCQDVDYKKGVIYVDDKEYMKMEVKKENFGLTKILKFSHYPVRRSSSPRWLQNMIRTKTITVTCFIK